MQNNMYSFENDKIKTPYEVPKDYFTDFAERCMARIGESDQHSDTEVDMIDNSPRLEVPSDYFANMQKSVLARTSSNYEGVKEVDLVDNNTYQAPKGYLDKKPTIKKSSGMVPLYSNRSIFTNIAATFLLILGLGYLFIKPASTTTSQNSSKNEEIEMATWENYLETEADVDMEQGNDPIVNLEYISDKEVSDFLQEEEEYLDIF